MSDFTDLLARFNRKERNIVIKNIIAKENLVISPKFLDSLKHSLGLEIPGNPFFAIDYHLDWLAVCTWLLEHNIDVENFDSGSFPGDDPERKYFITSNQADVDLLLAFELGERHHAILCEAKLDTPWKAKQVKTKIERIQYISNISKKVTFHYIALYPEFTKVPANLSECFESSIILDHDKNLVLSAQCIQSGNNVVRKNGSGWSVFPICKKSKPRTQK